ncbi:unnamed protein product [Pneumocystis jirovecii]|uniref:G-patch domain-containing protein n=1 Tax=Pneumocystis jirovecii TaxID=42068 RepID=L0PDS9_PNEJI|nr:unnamed protein product [Pneumocystis jirovecii]
MKRRVKKGVKTTKSDEFEGYHYLPSSISSSDTLEDMDCMFSSSFSDVSERRSFSEEILFIGKKFEKSKITDCVFENKCKPSGGLQNIKKVGLKCNFDGNAKELNLNKTKRRYKLCNDMELDYVWNIIDHENLNYNDFLKECDSNSLFLDNDIVVESGEDICEKMHYNIYNRFKPDFNVFSKLNCRGWKNENYDFEDENYHFFHMLNNLKNLEKNTTKRRQKIYQRKYLEQNIKAKKNENRKNTKTGRTLRELLLKVNNIVCQFISDSDLMELDLISMDSQARRWIHMLANAYGIGSKSFGTERSRHVILYKTTKIHDNYSKQHVNRVLQSLNHNQYNRKVSQRKDPNKSRNNTSKNSNRNGNRYHDGDIVAKNVPEIDKNNRGRIMLEKLGWIAGNGLGAPDNKGIEVPIVAIIKTTKSGLR